MSPTSLAALIGLGVLVVGWLLVVVMRPSPARAVVEWIATTAMYVALGSWFLGLSRGAWAEGHVWLLVPFGFLTVLFAGGLCVSLYKTAAEILGRGSGFSSATH